MILLIVTWFKNEQRKFCVPRSLDCRSAGWSAVVWWKMSFLSGRLRAASHLRRQFPRSCEHEQARLRPRRGVHQVHQDGSTDQDGDFVGDECRSKFPTIDCAHAGCCLIQCYTSMARGRAHNALDVAGCGHAFLRGCLRERERSRSRSRVDQRRVCCDLSLPITVIGSKIIFRCIRTLHSALLRRILPPPVSARKRCRDHGPRVRGVVATLPRCGRCALARQSRQHPSLSAGLPSQLRSARAQIGLNVSPRRRARSRVLLRGGLGVSLPRRVQRWAGDSLYQPTTCFVKVCPSECLSF